jgi:hypothetical protein
MIPHVMEDSTALLKAPSAVFSVCHPGIFGVHGSGLPLQQLRQV